MISKTVTIFSRVLVHKDKYVSRAILYADGRCEVIDYSCYGAG